MVHWRGSIPLTGANKNITDMKQSLDRIMWTYNDDVKVYSGHGEMTTIGHERKFNPYLR